MTAHGECLLDGDAFVGRDQDPNPYFHIDSNKGWLILNNTDTLRVGDQLSFAQGVFCSASAHTKLKSARWLMWHDDRRRRCGGGSAAGLRS